MIKIKIKENIKGEEVVSHVEFKSFIKAHKYIKTIYTQAKLRQSKFNETGVYEAYSLNISTTLK